MAYRRYGSNGKQLINFPIFSELVNFAMKLGLYFQI